MELPKTSSYLSQMKDSNLSFKEKVQITKEKSARFLFGFNENRGFMLKFVIYTLLVSIGFVYLYPMLHIFVTSMKSLADLLDSSIKWIPSTFYKRNYEQAFSVMNLKAALKESLSLSLILTIFLIASACLFRFVF